MNHASRLYRMAKGLKNFLAKPREVGKVLRKIDNGVDAFADEVDLLEDKISDLRFRIANGEDRFKELVTAVTEKQEALVDLENAKSEQTWFNTQETKEEKDAFKKAVQEDEEAGE